MNSSFNKTIQIPNKIQWLVDLSTSESLSLPKKIMRRIPSEDYSKKIILNLVALAYRCFNHPLAKKLNLKMLDYYAELKIRDYVRSLKLSQLSHGHDKHPLNQVGLSAWKLQIGARPALPITPNIEEYTYAKLINLAAQNGVSGFYSDPQNNFFTKFHLFKRNNNQDETIISFIKAANSQNIEVVEHIF